MKMIIIFAALFAAVLAAKLDVPAGGEVQLLRYVNDNVENAYKYGFESSDGITRNEEGKLVHIGTEDEALEVRGHFTYTGPDNVIYSVSYTSGRAGFVPSGVHIPTNDHQ